MQGQTRRTKGRTRWPAAGRDLLLMQLLVGLPPEIAAAGGAEGACCPETGPCVVASSTACAAQNGEYLGDGVQCPTDGQCLGACCLSGVCGPLFSRSTCLNLGADYQGTGTTCNVSTCGAPCASDADCSDGNACNGNERCFQTRCYPRTRPNCNDQNVCTNDTCNLEAGCVHAPTGNTDCGTCCTPGGGCVPALESFCTGVLYGTFRGLGTSCGDKGICVGPCCLNDFECVEVERPECYDLKGWFNNPGEFCETTDCTPTGACCSGYGECRMVDEQTCNRMESAFRGPDTTCDTPGICDSACCFGGGSCAVMPDVQCWKMGAYSQGPWEADCGPCVCHQVGACCLPGGGCVIEPEYYCTASWKDGTFVGGDCEPYPCACEGDGECQDGDADNGEEFCDAGSCRGLDWSEYNSLLKCFDGPAATVGLDCWCADRNADGHADLADAARLFNGD